MYQCCRCEKAVVETNQNRQGHHYCVDCVGFTEAQMIVERKSIMNPLHLIEFDAYHQSLAVIRGSSNMYLKNRN